MNKRILRSQFNWRKPTTEQYRFCKKFAMCCKNNLNSRDCCSECQVVRRHRHAQSALSALVQKNKNKKHTPHLKGRGGFKPNLGSGNRWILVGIHSCTTSHPLIHRYLCSYTGSESKNPLTNGIEKMGECHVTETTAFRRNSDVIRPLYKRARLSPVWFLFGCRYDHLWRTLRTSTRVREHHQTSMTLWKADLSQN